MKNDNNKLHSEALKQKHCSLFGYNKNIFTSNKNVNKFYEFACVVNVISVDKLVRGNFSNL